MPSEFHLMLSAHFKLFKQNVLSITKLLFRDQHVKEWHNTLNHLTVQSKFNDVLIVEEENKTWSHLLTGLSYGQFSSTPESHMLEMPSGLGVSSVSMHLELGKGNWEKFPSLAPQIYSIQYLCHCGLVTSISSAQWISSFVFLFFL